MISRKRISYAARDIGEGYDMQQHIIRILRYQGGVKHIISTDLTQVEEDWMVKSDLLLEPFLRMPELPDIQNMYNTIIMGH